MAKCRKCGAELVIGETWWLSNVKQHQYICIKCAKAKNRRWCEENPNYHRQWNKKHPNYHRSYRRQRNEELLSYMRQWREEHPGYHRNYMRQWQKENPDKVRKRDRRWRMQNPNKVTAQKHRRRARKYSVAIEPVDVTAIYELYNHTCIYCGAAENLTIDHVVSLAIGGTHCEDNLVVACRGCNSSKGAKSLENWLYTQPNTRAWVT